MNAFTSAERNVEVNAQADAVSRDPVTQSEEAARAGSGVGNGLALEAPLDKLVQCLLASGALSEAALGRARHAAQTTGERFDLVLPRLGLVPDRDVAAAWAKALGIALVDSAALSGELPFLDHINVGFLKKFKILPIEKTEQGVAVAMADPLDDYAARALGYVLEMAVERRVAAASDLDRAFEALEAQQAAGNETLDGSVIGGEMGEADIARLRDLASEAPVIKLVNGLIARAVEQRASDIHVEPAPGRLRVRYRIDGMLRDAESPAPALAPAVASRIKIMAGLDIAERRRPQDGRVRLALQGREVDLRVATTPALHGETIVLRILDRTNVTLDFEKLGFSGPTLET